MRRSRYSLLGYVAVATLSAWQSTAFGQASGFTTEAQPLSADSAEVQGSPPDQSLQEVTVSGSRVITNGNDAPTPISVVGIQLIQNQAQADISSLLDELPVFTANESPNTQGTNSTPSSGLTGENILNLRGLGVNRTLVLVDGQRFVPTLTYGSVSTEAVDIGGLPQQLIQRTDIVTGGASAVYGSDAVGGVVNFILDKNFTGLKVDASGGSTVYLDDYNAKLDVTYGTGFADNRGHFLISGEVYSKAEITDASNRSWDNSALCVMTNPNWTATNHQPNKITVPYCGEASAPGGVINTGPLAGTTFGPGGVPLPFQYGLYIPGSALMSGGSYQLAQSQVLTRGSSLDPGEHRENFFSLLSYDLTDTIKATYTLSLADTTSNSRTQEVFEDAGGGVTLQSNNAFIPASLRPALAAAGNPSFKLSSLSGDIPDINTDNDRFVLRQALAFDGHFDLLNKAWTWDAYYQYGLTRNSLNAMSINLTHYTNAVNAIYAPNGTIVCGDYATNPTCVPFDLFGIGVNSPAAVAYVQGYGHVFQTNSQGVLAAQVTGQPFSLWAGPVGIALSAEHRQENAWGDDVANSLANNLFSGNYKPIEGTYHVTEGAFEAEVPLAHDLPLVYKWDTQLAVRETDYSTSGFTTTWKVGTTYSPIADVIIRGNISRDIRAGNLGELYAFAGAPIPNPGTFDPFTNTSVEQPRVSSTGNPHLDPEVADSRGLGLVWTPSFLPGLSASVDYWKVAIEGEIAALSAAQALQLCYDHNAQACSFITRSGSATIPGVGPYAGQLFAPLAFITTSYVNIASTVNSGLDEFAAYQFPFHPFDGNVALRWDGTYYFHGVSNPGVPGSLPTYFIPYWRGIATATYARHDWSFGFSARFASKDAYDYTSIGQIIQCGSNCPLLSAIPTNFTTYNYYYHKSSLFFDFNVARNLVINGVDTQFYLNVRNLFNTAPPLAPPGAEPFALNQSSVGDDALGMIIRVGLRVRM